MSFKDFAKDKYPLPHSFKTKPFNILTDLKPGMRVIHKDEFLVLPGVFVRYGTIEGKKVIFMQTKKYNIPTWSDLECASLDSSDEPSTSAAA